MPFKTNRAPGTLRRLSGFSLLGFTGPDAGTFLQAQTMNDVRGLAARQWHWNGWLSPKGRVIALFALLKSSDEEYVAILPDYPAEELQLLLQRFVFRSKVKLQAITDLVPAADLEPEAESMPRHQAAGNRQTGVRLDVSGNQVRRHLLLLPSASEELGQPAADCDLSWFDADVAHGLPRLAPSQREAWTPQMLSLERLLAFSLKKGCYPGQEIVARTHYLGQARRGLSRVVGSGLEPGAAIRDEHGVAFGSVVSARADATQALAVIQLDKRIPEAWVGDQAVFLPAFLEGLQRPL